ncbi:MAG: UDP-N-acetylmuramoyl-L-alanine--D-glutamate ligase, partial [Chloroflexi bacterium]|nr:UDP-N-acetylmuramoyl-L-alanine--D-glutamate ligase [Chloroflexota bacterium]
NIGHPPLSGLEGASASTLFVLELSSYQLAFLRRSPHIAVLQNIVPEHLDYHGSFEEYVKAKANITAHQTEQDTLIFNAGYPIPQEIARTSRAQKRPFGLDPAPDRMCFEEDGWIVLRSGGELLRVLPVDRSPLRGRFNLQNVMPAVLAGQLFEIPLPAIAESIATFTPLEHRVEAVGVVNGVEYYDDSISTVPEAAIAAMDTFAGRPVVLLAGGHNRGVDYGILARALLEREVRAVILFRPTGETIAKELDRIGGERQPARFLVETMSEAVEIACQTAQPGDVVLLSPASASYGRYRDFRERGDQFQAEVRRRQERRG